MSSSVLTRLLDFLENDLAIPAESLAIALRHGEHATQLPMILWQYGLVSLEQLNLIFDWLVETPQGQ
jgi:hypothetical protein